jgi:hypothetical protein
MKVFWAKGPESHAAPPLISDLLTIIPASCLVVSTQTDPVSVSVLSLTYLAVPFS